MGLLPLLILALAVSAGDAADACQCVGTDAKIDPISNPMIFWQQPTTSGLMNGPPCAANCTFVAHAFDEDNDGLMIQILTNSLGTGKITVYDGVRTFPIVKSTTQADITWKSTGGSLTFELNEDSTNVGTFMIVIQKADKRDPAPTIVSTTAAPSTPAYTGGLKRNPLLVADDIMIGIDLSSDRLEDLKAFAIDIIRNLTVTNSNDCGDGSRLALHGLSSYPNFSPTYFPDWEYTADNAIGNIQAMTRIGDKPFYINDVDKFVTNGFKDNDPRTPEIENCPNRGRIYVLLTTQQPQEYNVQQPSQTPPPIKFIDQGVHPILVSTLKAGTRPYYDLYKDSNKWSYYDVDKMTLDFFNNYLVDSSDDLTCQPTTKDISLSADTVESVNALTISIPPYYNGKKDSADPESEWNTIQHYCNFQSATVTISQNTTSKTLRTDVCLTVFYDLETDKDFVSIYSGDFAAGNQKQIVKLTGRDVSGTTFRLGAKVGSIIFSSDEKNVYDGFYAKVYACGDKEKS